MFSCCCCCSSFHFSSAPAGATLSPPAFSSFREFALNLFRRGAFPSSAIITTSLMFFMVARVGRLGLEKGELPLKSFIGNFTSPLLLGGGWSRGDIHQCASVGPIRTSDEIYFSTVKVTNAENIRRGHKNIQHHYTATI